MKDVKRYFAPDMRQAIKLVREDLGPDAIILSNRKMPGGVEINAVTEYNPQQDLGKQEVKPGVNNAAVTHKAPKTVKQQDKKINAFDDYERRVHLEHELKCYQQRLASEDHAEQMHKQSSNRLPKANDKHFSSMVSSIKQGSAVLSQKANDGFDNMRSEIKEFKTLLSSPVGNNPAKSKGGNNINTVLWRRLSMLNLPGNTIKMLLEKNKEKDIDSAWRHALANIANGLSCFNEEMIDQGGIIALLGPTGVGKTTTIEKLATRFVLKNSADDVALISTDQYRIAAHNQLRIFGKILGVTVRVVDESNDLEKVLSGLRGKKLILIDTAGLNKQDDNYRHQMALLKKPRFRIKHTLLLPATSQVQVLKSVLHSYRDLDLYACIFTKLDETTSLGESISVAMSHQLPVAYITDGQKIPDDIRVGRAHSIVSRAVALAQEYEQDRDGFTHGNNHNFNQNEQMPSMAMPKDTHKGKSTGISAGTNAFSGQ